MTQWKGKERGRKREMNVDKTVLIEKNIREQKAQPVGDNGGIWDMTVYDSRYIIWQEYINWLWQHKYS